jgi:hypothetical protein
MEILNFFAENTGVTSILTSFFLIIILPTALTALTVKEEAVQTNASKERSLMKEDMLQKVA